MRDVETVIYMRMKRINFIDYEAVNRIFIAQLVPTWLELLSLELIDLSLRNTDSFCAL